MEKSTDQPRVARRGVTSEHASQAAAVLAQAAMALATTSPHQAVDSMEFTVLVGTRAYDQAGRSCHGGGQNVSRAALAAVAERTGLTRGDVPPGVSREEFAVTVAQAAGDLGHDWSGAQTPGKRHEPHPAVVGGPAR
ncbi:hypothetical protein [Streptomyces alfalfae]